MSEEEGNVCLSVLRKIGFEKELCHVIRFEIVYDFLLLVPVSNTKGTLNTYPYLYKASSGPALPGINREPSQSGLNMYKRDQVYNELTMQMLFPFSNVCRNFVFFLPCGVISLVETH